MTRAARPILITSVNLLWYAVALLPVFALLYFSFTGALPAMVAMLALFAAVFWVVSLAFAIWTRLRRTQQREYRQ
jgi:hypothetical protein